MIFHCGLTCISLIISDIDLFIKELPFCMFSLEKSTQVLCPFKNIFAIELLNSLYYTEQSIHLTQSMLNSNDIFYKSRTNSPKFVWNHEYSEQPEKSLKKKNKDGSITFPAFKRYCKVIVIKQYGIGIKTNRSKEQHRDFRNKCVHIWSINLQQRGQEYTLGKELLSVNALEINRSLYFKKKKERSSASTI